MTHAIYLQNKKVWEEAHNKIRLDFQTTGSAVSSLVGNPVDRRLWQHDMNRNGDQELR